MNGIPALFRRVACLAILAVTVACPTQGIAAASAAVAAKGVGATRVEVAIDGVASAEVAGIDALQWRDGNSSLAPLVLDAWLMDNGALAQWVQESLAAGSGKAPAKTLDLTVTDSGKALEAWHLPVARIVRVEFDDFDAASKAAWRYKVTIDASSARPGAGKPATATPAGVRQKATLQSNFSVTYGTLPTQRVVSVKGLTIALDGSSPAVNAVMTVSTADYPGYVKWRTPPARGAQDLVISVLGPDLRAVLATVRLPGATVQHMTLPLGTPPSLGNFEIGLAASSLLLDLGAPPPPGAAAVPTLPGVTPLPGGTLRATVAKDQVNRYSAAVSAGTQVVSLTGIVGAAKLDVYSDPGFTQPVACLAPRNLSNSTYAQPADCSFVATGGTVYVSVTGTSYLATASNSYNIRVSPRNEAAPANQGTEQDPMVIQPDKPFAGTTGTDYSYYKVTTAGTGDVVISLTGLIGTEDVGLHIYDNAKFIGPVLDNANCQTPQFLTFAESCNLPAGRTYYLMIRSVNPGGPFTLMVDSPR